MWQYGQVRLIEEVADLVQYTFMGEAVAAAVVVSSSGLTDVTIVDT